MCCACAGVYVKDTGKGVANGDKCRDKDHTGTTEILDSGSNRCSWYETSPNQAQCHFANTGTFVAGTACCKCGGGHIRTAAASPA